MTVQVDYSQIAIAQLEDLYRYIADTAGPHRAEAFVASITEHCEGFAIFPHRGMQRDDLRPGLRIVGFRRR